MPPPSDHTNKTYAMLTGIKFAGHRGTRRLWLWQCECGNQKVIPAEKVVSKRKDRTKSCGCLTAHHNRGRKAIAYAIWNEYRRDTDGYAITFDDFLRLSQEDCFYCGCPPTRARKGRSKSKSYYVYNGLDRVNNAGQHTLDNVVPCCWTCNERKKKDAQEEFIKWIQRCYATLKRKGIIQ